jgi:cell division protein ZapE
LPAYRALVAAGSLAPDPAQAVAAERLQDLWERLREYAPEAAAGDAGGGGLLSRLLRRRHAEEYVPTGLYLVGEVGRGKSMLMDMFFHAADVPRKQRIHFHRFMQNVHTDVHAWKMANPAGTDPLPPLANKIAAESALLCFDEFQVNDIADAMILGRLFQGLFDRGVVVVATSNTALDNLFEGRPGRDAFLPFIALMKQRLEILELPGSRDYRRERLRKLRTWHVPPNEQSRRELDAAFEKLSDGAEPASITLTVMGRAVTVPQAAGGVARFDFDRLCNTALGPGDYLAIAANFHTLILDGIPLLSPDNFDQARRFIVLVDTLYDQRVKLIASAEARPDRLYEHGRDVKMFERTASRLDEMQSQDWLDLARVR